MKISIQTIASLFSKGEFKKVEDYLADEIIWNIVGENLFIGKEAVKVNCEKTEDYFNSVDTDFKIIEILQCKEKVIITGSATFSKDGKALTSISACDIYEFNSAAEITAITSYCIPVEDK